LIGLIPEVFTLTPNLDRLKECIMNRRELLITSLTAIAGLGSGASWRLSLANPDKASVGSDTARFLNALQLGHLQHIRNLASVPDGEWRHMGSLVPGQEMLDSYRYQLAFMAYSLGLTAYHYLPAAPRTLQPAFDSLIQKMLNREVWDYWKETSRSGPNVDPGLTELREAWTDPVVKENIMYSGHLQVMVAMYRMLFNDTKYDAPGSLTFRYAPVFSGLGPEVFEYNHEKLNNVIYDQFSEHNWLGIPCEPNMVFVVCNQYPIYGFRFYDAVHGTSRAEEVIAEYDKAWKDLVGYVGDDGELATIYMERQNHILRQPTPLNAWTLAALNAWKPELVHSLQKRHAELWLEERPGGRVSVRANNEIMALAAKQPLPETRSDWRSPDFGYVALWLSEMGDQSNLDGLLAHADEFMRPTWENGGFFYPRNDQSYDASGELTYMDPLTGNALLAYARLNPPDGMKTMFQQPWYPNRLNEFQIIGFEGASLLRATYAADGNAIQFAIGMQDEQTTADVVLLVAGLAPGREWSIRRVDQALAPQFMSSGQAQRESKVDGTRISAAGIPPGEYRLQLI
jgi:hypothetical protein